MRWHLSVGVVICALAVAGCASNHGAQSVNDFSRYMRLEEGITTKTDVYTNFGQPHTVNYINETGESMWSYYSVRARTNPATYIPYVGLVAGGSDLDVTSATFFFDPEGLYLRSDRNERSRYQNQWTAMADGILTQTGQVEKVREEMDSLGLPFDQRSAQNNAGIADVWANE